MRAVVCKEIGSLDRLELGEHPAPVAGPGEVLVEVRAASLNFPDILIVQGLYQFAADPPFVPGAEGAGVVVAVGDGVTGVAPGNEVTFSATAGAFAELCAVPASAVLPKASNMPFVEASAFHFVFGTSFYALRQRARLQTGETLLVMGAAGGVGSAAVQLGAAMGARVIAAASSPEKLDFAASLGAAAGIDYSTEDLKTRLRELTQGRGVDVVLDPVGGRYAEPAIRALAWEGRYLVVGFTAGEIPRIPLNLPLLKGTQLVGVFWGSWLARDPTAAARNVAALFEMYDADTIRPVVDEVFDLGDFRDAFSHLTERRVQGKVVLTI